MMFRLSGLESKGVDRVSHLKYRPDIDGLRAVAVLIVVLNHVGFSYFTGGFVGVDVFFVISGYLITGIILKQASLGTFSFREFYIRRARRILPALYVVLLVVTLAGYYLYLPSDYTLVSQSALSAIAFSANIFFWKNSGGYFSSGAEEMPFLHIWSLSVEEQFYFIWPLVLLLLLRVRVFSLVMAIVLAGLVFSFALAELGVVEGWSGTYFLLPFRGGELLVGGALAMWAHQKHEGKQNNLVANAFSGLGLLLVLAPVFFLDKASGFPGLNALIPCMGAALIIASPLFGSSVVSRLLSTKPFVFIGLISYSLYLWHWPLISILHYSRVEFTAQVMAGTVVASLVLGYLSWRYVEKVFRDNGDAPGRKVLVATAVGTLLVLIVPSFIYINGGVPSRFPFALLSQDQLNMERQRYWRDIETKGTDFSGLESIKKVLVVGNSHAYDFSYSLTENEFAGKIKLIETTYHCFNFGGSAVAVDKKELCEERFQIVLGSEELKSVDVVYLHDNWSGKDFSVLENTLNSIRAITKAPIYVIGPKMTFQQSVLSISKLAQEERHVSVASINEFSRKYQNPKLLDYDRELKNFFSERDFKNIRYVSALDVQCGPQMKCDILSGQGEYLYFDGGHFTLVGSRIFGKKLKETDSYLF